MKSIFKISKLKKYFSTNSTCSGLNYEFPDIILRDLKDYLNVKNNSNSLNPIENRIINNIHYFDSDQYTDLVTLLASHSKGTVDLWDLLNRKIGDYELNFIQATEIKNLILDSGKYFNEIDWYCSRVIYSLKESESQRSTYNMIKH